MDQLPPERCQDYPLLCLLQAWALLFLGQLDAVEPIVQIVEANQGKAPGIPLPGYVSTVRAYLANMQGDVLKSTNLTEVALEEMSQAPPDRMTLIFQGSAVIWLGINYRRWVIWAKQANYSQKQPISIRKRVTFTLPWHRLSNWPDWRCSAGICTRRWKSIKAG